MNDETNRRIAEPIEPSRVTGVNPPGVRVLSFKVPSTEELDRPEKNWTFSTADARGDLAAARDERERGGR